MLSIGWILLIAAIIIGAVMAYEAEHRSKPVAGLYPNAGHRIMPKDNAYFLHAGTDSPADCLKRVNAYHSAGTALGGFDYGSSADPGCHIYRSSMGKDGYTLMKEAAYTSYLPRASGNGKGRVMAP